MPNFNGNRIKNFDRARANGLKKKAKIPYKKHNHINGVKLSGDVVRQNVLRARMRTIGKQLRLSPVKEVGTGVDYKTILKKGKKTKPITIDIKFSFGLLGDGVIKARVANRRLINNANYAFAIDRQNQVHVFSVKKLEQYIRENYGKLSQKNRIDRGNHFEFPIKLSEFYSTMNIEPLIVGLNINGVNKALDHIKRMEFKEEKIKTMPIQTTSSKINNFQKINHTQQNIIFRRGMRGK